MHKKIGSGIDLLPINFNWEKLKEFYKKILVNFV